MLFIIITTFVVKTRCSITKTRISFLYVLCITGPVCGLMGVVTEGGQQDWGVRGCLNAEPSSVPVCRCVAGPYVYIDA